MAVGRWSPRRGSAAQRQHCELAMQLDWESGKERESSVSGFFFSGFIPSFGGSRQKVKCRAGPACLPPFSHRKAKTHFGTKAYKASSMKEGSL